ncbi:MAG: AAA family ATPase [Mycobacteriaceae bacterium]
MRTVDRSVVVGRPVGRERELALLAGAWAAARRGQGGTVALAGEAGIGKTRLSHAAVVTAADQDGLVLRGRAVATGVPAAFRPLAEALCAAVRTVGLPGAAELVPFRALLGRLVPEWACAERGDPDSSIVPLAEAVLRFLRVVAGSRGALLVLEDLHWADPGTLAVVEYLADNLTAERVLCVFTVRDDEDSDGWVLTRRLAARRVCELAVLRRLGPVDVAEMVADCLHVRPAPEPALTVTSRAAGVPLLVEAMLVSAVKEGRLVQDRHGWRLTDLAVAPAPTSYVDGVRLRLAGLDRMEVTVVRAAAALGAFDTDLLADTAGTDEGRVASTLAACVRVGLVTVDGDSPGFGFPHVLTAEAINASLLPPERVTLCERALTALTERRPGLLGAWCEIAAELAEGAGHRARAAALLRQLARRELCSGDLGRSRVTLERARRLGATDAPTATAVEQELLEVLTLVGDHGATMEVGTALLARLAAGPDDDSRRAAVHLQLARAAVAASRWRQARAHVELARTGLAQDPRDLSCRLDAVDAAVAVGECDLGRARELAQRARAVAEAESLADVACEAWGVLGRCHRPHDLAAADAAFARQHDVAVRAGMAWWRVRALHERGVVELLRSGATDRLTQARDAAVQLGAVAAQAAIEVHLCIGLVLHGGGPGAEDAASRTAELSRGCGLGQLRAAALGLLAVEHARARRGPELDRVLAEAVGCVEDDADLPAIAVWARAVQALVVDDRATALVHLGAAEVLAPTQGRGVNPATAWWVLLRVVDADGAEAALAHGRRDGGPVDVVTRGFLGFADAIVSGRAGHAEEATQAVEVGAQLLGELDWVRHFGLRWVSQAAVTDGWGRPVPWLREAEAFFAVEAQPWLTEACRSLLRRTGTPIPRRREADRGVPGPLRDHGVTAREFEVVALLAEGLPNAVIAQRLYLSPRTVERHIANVCVKVGVDRRAQLVALGARTVRG